MLKRIKQIKNKRLIVADALLVAALVIAFAVTYDISKHAGLYLLSGEMLVKSKWKRWAYRYSTQTGTCAR